MPVAIVSRQWGRDGTSRSQGQSKEQCQGLEPWWSLFLELQDLAGIFLNSNKEAYVMAELSELWVGESCLLRGSYRWGAGSWLWRVGVLELQKNQGCPLLCFVGRPMTSGWHPSTRCWATKGGWYLPVAVEAACIAPCVFIRKSGCI